MKPAVPGRLRPAAEALVLGAITVAVVGVEPRAFLAGALVAAAFWGLRLRRMRELDRVRSGVALAATGVRPEEWRGLSAETAEGEIMGVRHRTHPVEGVQFHPESILTHAGKALLRNFLVQPVPVAAERR